MRKVRVLIADDNQDICEVLSSRLSSDFDVICCCQGSTSGLAILDICMPVLNGIEVARRLKQISKNMVVVLLTASTDLDLIHGGRAGVSAYVLKPRLWTDLLPGINMALTGVRFVSPGLR
jgi:CheY-like chemotaxis protein